LHSRFGCDEPKDSRLRFISQIFYRISCRKATENRKNRRKPFILHEKAETHSKKAIDASIKKRIFVFTIAGLSVIDFVSETFGNRRQEAEMKFSEVF
jgi:hypothetical protein